MARRGRSDAEEAADGEAGADGAEAVEPAVFVAVTTYVYVLPAVRPLTVQVVVGGVAEQVAPLTAVPPLYACAVYDAGPPVDAVQATVWLVVVMPETATFVGALGALAAVGVIEFDAVDALDVAPGRLVAVAVNVYDVPGVSGLMTQDVCGGCTVQLPPPEDAVTVYDVIGPPVFGLGGVTVIVAKPAPATATGAPGVLGAGVR